MISCVYYVLNTVLDILKNASKIFHRMSSKGKKYFIKQSDNVNAYSKNSTTWYVDWMTKMFTGGGN